jgi:hypothetical protein
MFSTSGQKLLRGDDPLARSQQQKAVGVPIAPNVPD